jgi:hypothetical protein
VCENAGRPRHNGDPIPVNPFKDYFWMGTSMGMANEADSDDIEAYCPGLDCAVNTHPALNNLEKMTPLYDEGGLHRSVDPGAGAITPYHNGSTYVYRDIPAGGELFKDYGTSWFHHRWHIFKHIPMSDDYDEAEALLTAMESLNVKNDVKEDLYGIVAGLQPGSGSASDSFRSMVLKALPESYRDVRHMKDENRDIPSLHQHKHVQPLDYLRKHGKCLDHIQNKRSTIPGAGRGAFAVRDLPKGTVISASPLHHIDDGFANMYNFTQLDDGGWAKIQDQVVGKQLMLNYCYRHPQSTVLFCPYGSGINYLNHHRELANVRIRWAANFSVGHNQSMLEGPLQDLLATPKPKLSFDYVATKDIKEGDELFLDYGDDWVAAWEKHAKTWQPLARAESYASARLMNERFPDSVLRTEDEQRFDPYPPNLELRCHKGLFNAAGKTDFTWHMNDVGMPCKVLLRDVYKDTVLYTVELEFRHGKEITRSQRADVPRQSLAFIDVPGTTDMHQPNVFRHPVGIPDDIYPNHWKNRLDEGADAADLSSSTSTPDVITKPKLASAPKQAVESQEEEYYDSSDEDDDEEDVDDDDYSSY